MRFIKRFDRAILIPLLIILITYSVLFLLKKHWVDGLFLLLISILVLRIKFYLKKKSTYMTDEPKKISKEEMYILKLGFIIITFLSSFIFLFLSIYHGLKWWQVMFGSIGILFGTPIILGLIFILTSIFNKR